MSSNSHFFSVLERSRVNAFSVHVCCSMWAPGVHGRQKTVSNALELELRMVVSCYVSVGNWTQVLRKSKSVPVTPVLGR